VRLRSLFVSAVHPASAVPTGEDDTTLDGVGGSSGRRRGVALVALGGYGRGELSVASDLDVLLLHDERCPDVGAVAERLWYPLWDEGTRLDHSVRTLAEALDAARADLRSALAMLDARHVAGDAGLTLQLRTTLLTLWRRRAHRWLPELAASCRERAERFGDLAYLLEPDLKEARGGLRDGVVLRALAATWLVEVPHGTLARLRSELLDVRDVLHQVAGRRPTDRLTADLQPEVAHGCGLPDRDALLRHLFRLGRATNQVFDVAWRRAGRALAVRWERRVPRPRPGPPLRPLAPGVATVDGEVVLAADARPSADPLLPLRAAYCAADRGLLLSPRTAAQLAREGVALPEPWPEEARRLLTALLGSGPDLVPVWETLDQAGLIAGVLPEWDRVRWAPQYSPVHRYTVDRHLLQTCVEAARLVRRVQRPDLLLVAALLHDLGKGGAGPTRDGLADHSVVGAELVPRVAARWGFEPRDVATLTTLVRHHLTLVEAATRRDIDDPATIRGVADVLGDVETLELLAALTEADARATGPAAWTPWRAGLTSRLVSRVRGHLTGGLTGGQPPTPSPLRPWQQAMARRGVPDVVVEPKVWPDAVRVTVVARDREGLLVAVAGVLAAARLSVRAASVHTVDGMAVSVWTVAGDLPDASALRERLRAAILGGGDGSATGPVRVDARERPSRMRERRPATIPPTETTWLGARTTGPEVGPPPKVRIVAGASRRATVLEVHAHDRPGLFRDICVELARAGCSVRSAHVSTWGGEAVDVLYLTAGDGRPLGEREADHVRRTLQMSLRSAAGSKPATRMMTGEPRERGHR
jgi:[protein-PII] uridylyltransferase